MRTTLTALVIVGVASGASAQSSDVLPSSEARSNPDGPILSIGLPLPRIGLPLPPTGLRPPADSKARAGQEGRDGKKGGHRRGKGDHHRRPAPVPVVPYFWPYPFVDTVGPPASQIAERAPAPAEKLLTGTLYLDVHPASVQVFVDGYYVGTTDEADGGLQLEAVPHRLEFRAPGYEALTLDVNIPADRVTIYRGALTPVRRSVATDDPASATPQTASGSSATFYVIPGCYLGNVPPKDAGLPDACAERRAVTIQR